MGETEGWLCVYRVGRPSNAAALARSCDAQESSPESLLEAAFDLFGRAALDRIEGEVAGVLWDGAGRRLVAFRDRLGLQPMLFVDGGARIAIGSSAPCLVSRLTLSAEPHLPSLVDFLLTGGPSVGSTFYRRVEALEPGEAITVSRHGVERRSWWSLTARRAIPEREAAEAVVETLDEVVRERLAERRPALTLSGGLDSASVGAAMRRARPDNEIIAITWVTPSLPTADESAAAAVTSRHLGARSFEMPVDKLWPLSSPDGFSTRPESPFRSPYQEAWRATFRLAADLGLDHLATGAGGDQLFGFGGPGVYGYPDLLLSGRWWELAQQVARHDRVSEAALLRILDRELVRPLLRPLVRALRPVRSWAPTAAWIGERWRSELRDRLRPPPVPRGMLPGRRHRHRLLCDRFQPVVLQSIEALGAEAGVAPWFPLVDHRLWELAARLPSTTTFRAGYHKAVLREGLHGRLPESCLGRRRKIHAASLFDRGLRERESAKVWPLLEEMRAAELGLVDEAELRNAYRSYLEGGSNSHFWYALCVEDWLRRYF